METKSYTTIDRAGWPSGEWNGEPDKIQWQDKATGLPCLAVRHEDWGHWCGYVGVPEGHWAYGKDNDSVPAEVHGGLTFANHCQLGSEAEAICHVPAEGEPDNVWWLGFDCAHVCDRSPGREKINDLMRSRYPDSQIGFLMQARMQIDAFSEKEVYRTLAYVQSECASLAKQLAEVA